MGTFITAKQVNENNKFHRMGDSNPNISQLFTYTVTTYTYGSTLVYTFTKLWLELDNWPL